MKTCTKCKEEKPLADFHKKGKKVDGSTKFDSQCKPCLSVRKKEMRERGKANQWLTLVREIGGQGHICQSNRKAEYLCKCGNTHVAVKGIVKCGGISSCGCKKIELSTTHGQADHPLYDKSSKANTTARHYGQPDHLLPVQVEQLFDQHGWSCYYCGTQSTDTSVMTLDHVVPFARGGTNTIQNCVPACASCNTSKCDRTEQEFLSSRNQGEKV